jgi:hypothetical protein
MVARGLLVIAVLAAGLASAPGHARVANHNPVEVVDPVGDGNGAPDITGVTVANDLSGRILFVVEVANRTDFVARDEMLVFIDSDRSAATGSPDHGGGIDYRFRIDATSSDFERWNGTSFQAAPRSTVRVAWANGYVASVHRSELGNTSSFAFYAMTRMQEGPGSQFDVAPTGSLFPYALSPPHIEAIRARFSAAAPRAGSTFKVNSVQLQFETAEIAAAAAVTCRATLSGKRIRGTGRGGCTFKLPKTAKGKRFVITMTVAAAGGRAETFPPYAFRVR